MSLFDNLLDDEPQIMNNSANKMNEYTKQKQGQVLGHSNTNNATDPATGILLRHLDPRPDIEADHEDWVDMLQNCLVWAGLKDGKKLWGVLHGLRCGGARVQRNPKSELGYKLLPGNEDWKQEAEWQRIRKEHLDGVKDDLISLFKMTKEHGRLPRMEEIWPETGDKTGEQNDQKQFSQEKLF